MTVRDDGLWECDDEDHHACAFRCGHLLRRELYVLQEKKRMEEAADHFEPSADDPYWEAAPFGPPGELPDPWGLPEDWIEGVPPDHPESDELGVFLGC